MSIRSTVVSAVLAVLGAGIALLGLPGTGLAAPHVTERAQATELYAPALRFYRWDTPSIQGRVEAADAQFSHRTTACERPYDKEINPDVLPPTGSKTYQLVTFVANLFLLDETQSKETIVTSHLLTAERSWATMKLADTKLQSLAREQAAEIAASLLAPRVSTCEFVHELALHKFSLAWAKQDPAVKEADHFLAETASEGGVAAADETYVQKKGLLTQKALERLANFPGEIG